MRKAKQNAPGFSKDTPKLLIYEALAALNRHFEKVLLDLEGLATLGLFPDRLQRQFLTTCKATLEATGAWTNFALVEILHQQSGTGYAARNRQQQEKAWEYSGRRSAPPEPHKRKGAANEETNVGPSFQRPAGFSRAQIPP